jgi:hypothetical protein
MVTKVADSKGRVTLGQKFANRTVLVEEIDDTEVRIALARVIPEREAWLSDNPKARAAVVRGLAQAKARRFAPAPDMAKARRIARATPDDSE